MAAAPGWSVVRAVAPCRSSVFSEGMDFLPHPLAPSLPARSRHRTALQRFPGSEDRQASAPHSQWFLRSLIWTPARHVCQAPVLSPPGSVLREGRWRVRLRPLHLAVTPVLPLACPSGPRLGCCPSLSCSLGPVTPASLRVPELVGRLPAMGVLPLPFAR